MEWTVDRLSAEAFSRVWNAAGTLDEVVARVRELVGGPLPRWTVLARAAAIRKAGAELKRFPPPAAGGP